MNLFMEISFDNIIRSNTLIGVSNVKEMFNLFHLSG